MSHLPYTQVQWISRPSRESTEWASCTVIRYTFGYIAYKCVTGNRRSNWITIFMQRPKAHRSCMLDVCLLDQHRAPTKPLTRPGSAFIKPDQHNPWIKDQIKITLLPIISHLLLPNFVSCGRACPSHMTQNLVTVGAKLWTADRFIVDPWSMDYADPVW